MLEYVRAKQLLVDEMLNRSASRFPNKTAIVDDKRRITYVTLLNRVNQVAGWFQSKGINKGDKVALLLYNSIEITECLIALGKIGAVAVLLIFGFSSLNLNISSKTPMQKC